MKNIFKKFRNIHCIGIGGSGLSGLAQILKKNGCKVSGSDKINSAALTRLAKENIKVYVGHKAGNLPAKTDLVIYSSAIPKTNPELKKAIKQKIPSMTYSKAVGLLSENYRTISVCGTHGKTTTTALAAAAMIAAKKDPTVIVGSLVKELGGQNYRVGKSEYLVVESCEHFRNFLTYNPKIIVITNIEADHLDYYKDLADYKSAFRTFIEKLPADGLLIANSDDRNVKDIVKDFRKSKMVLYGRNVKSDYRLVGKYIVSKNKKIAEIDLKIPGDHNLMNAAAVIALSSELKLDLGRVTKALCSFRGSARRFELKGIVNKTHIIDDYAHHPTEISVTLKALREKYGKKSKILCIFQPHQYSRTRLLLKDFAKAFKDADEVIIPNILRVRDKASDIESMTPEKLVREISKNHSRARYLKNFKATEIYAKKHLKDFDVIITMGAGDVWKISAALAG
jgi:UDP-N-acetylmuramate--alanine ligase